MRDVVARRHASRSSVADHADVASQIYEFDIRNVGHSFKRGTLSLVLQALHLLLTELRIRIDVDVAVGSTQLLVLGQNQGIDLHAKGVALNEAFVQVFY